MRKTIIISITLLCTHLHGYTQRKDVPVIIIMADQLRYDAIGKYTPNINALKKDGVSFNRTYTASPLCAPSRAAFFTGRYPNNTGGLINGWVGEDEHYRNVKSGTPNLYQTMSSNWDAWHVGKQHFFTQDKIDENPRIKVQWITQKDYKEWLKPQGVKSPGGREFTGFSPELVSGEYSHVKRYTIPVAKAYKEGLQYFPDDYFGEKSAEIIKKHNTGKPLLLTTMFLSPHPPFDIPAPYFDKIRQQDLNIPANVGQWYKDQSPLQLYALSGFIGSRYSRDDWAKLWPKYFGLVNLLDDETGKIIQALKDKGLYDKALIIFTADHGEMLGSHSLWMKMCMYEESTRVPLIIKFPSDFRPAVGETNQLVSLTDVWPTLMDFLQINPKDKTDGISLMPLLKNKSFNRNKVFIQYDGNAAYGSNQRCVVSGNYKLIMDTFKDEIYLELYDIIKDPEETVNLVMDPAYEALSRKLIGEIQEHMLHTNDLLKFSGDVYQNFISHYATLGQKQSAEN
ncbi:sulfatase-like hydrolase/transferase [Chitinophaga sp. MM2321]|uniref:sulfatase family protein n=1 Tax=Chitinophaga sp. MM2321 TaxID=3137178 RepID=UPI0032D5A0BB